MIVVAGGGTGGHLYPGIAIAQELQRRRPGLEILFAASGSPLERDILERQGYPLLPIASGGVVGKSIARRIAGGFKAFRGFVQSIGALRRIRPKMVIGVGGYASGPMVMAGVLMRLPILIHEQNYYPGLTNRLLAPWVGRVATSFPETAAYLGGRGTLTGNPIRPDFINARRKERGGQFHVLVFGGSQGSRAINAAVIAALGPLREHHSSFRFVHGTGPTELERVRAAYAEAGFDADVRSYIDQILLAYEGADLVVARSGASTMSEIAICGKASILIPLPQAAHDHQRYNARKLESVGAAIVMEEKSLTGEALAGTLLSLRDDPARLTRMEDAACSLAIPDAAARIADLAEEMVS